MTEIEENSFAIAKYMFDKKYFGSRMVVVADLKKEINLPPEDFNMAEEYLFAMRFLEGTSGGDSGFRSLKPAGLSFVTSTLRERQNLRAADQLQDIDIRKTLDVFISHSSADAAIAAAVIDLLRIALNIPSERIRCTSVDGYRLPVGASTEDQLRREVREAIAFIGLITSASLQSTYVLFELGARWGAELHLAPLLAAGAEGTILRGPLVGLNALSCDIPAQLHQLIDDIGGIIDRRKSSASAYQKYLDILVQLSQENRGHSASDQKYGLESSGNQFQTASNTGRLALLDRTLDFKVQRNTFQNSSLGVDSATAEAASLFKIMETEASETSKNSKHLRVELHWNNNNRLIVFARGISLFVEWCPSYAADMLEGSFLRIALWHGVLAPNRLRHGAPKEIRQVDYSADLDRDYSFCWTNGKDRFTSKELADKWFGRLFDEIEKQL